MARAAFPHNYSGSLCTTCGGMLDKGKGTGQNKAQEDRKMFVDYLYNADCEGAKVTEYTGGAVLVELPTGKRKRFYSWAGAVNYLIIKGFQFI